MDNPFEPESSGGITLTNDMFGIVDVDTPDAEVRITLLARPALGADDSFAYVAANGEVTIGDTDGVLSESLVAGTIEVHRNGAWIGSNSFTLDDLNNGRVRFVQDVRWNRR